VLRPARLRRIAPCAARDSSAADEPALPTSFANGAAGGYSQPELATANGFANPYTAGDATASPPLRMPLIFTGEGERDAFSTADVDGVQPSSPATAQRLWIPEQMLSPDGSSILAQKHGPPVPPVLVLPPEPTLVLPPAEPKAAPKAEPTKATPPRPTTRTAAPRGPALDANAKKVCAIG